MVATSKRMLWKGAIFFGPVHIPIALHPATSEQALNFDWLDKRSMDPVGYKRNKAPRSKLRGINFALQASGFRQPSLQGAGN